MKEIVKFVLWVLILIAIFRIATAVLGALCGSLVGVAVLAVLAIMIFKAATR